MVVVLVGVLLVTFASTATANATPLPPDSKSFAEDLQEFQTLESEAVYPGTEAWDALSTEARDLALRGFSDVEWLSETYDASVGPGLDEWASHFTTAEANAVADTVGELSSGMASLGADAQAAIGGGALDLAESAGLVTAVSAGILVGLFPIGARLAYEDITTGTNIITQAITSSTEDNSKIEAQGGVAAEHIRWSHWPKISSSSHPADVLIRDQEEHEHCSGCGRPAAEKLESEYNVTLQTYHGCCEGVYGSGEPDYLMEFEVSGKWYLGSAGMTGLGVTPDPYSEHWVWKPYPWEGESGYPQFIGEPIAGVPGNLQHVATRTIISHVHHDLCSGRAEPGCPGSSGNSQWDVGGVRAPSRMRMRLPKHATKAEVESLEGEGHYFNHSEGTPLTKENIVPNLERGVKKVKEGGQKSLGKAICHFTQCEMEYAPAEVETPNSEAQPEKREDTPPQIPGTTIVPNCTFVEMSGVSCEELVKEHGFNKTKIEELGWEHAVVTKSPLTTIRTSPVEGSEVETSTEITVVENPDTEHFPVAVPAIGYGHETASEYKARLESEGWTKVSINTLTETATDPHIGPDQASYTVPAEGSETPPGRGTPIIVEANPSDAPIPPEGGGIGAPTVPAIKLPEIPTPCNRFPFGIPCWLVDRLVEFATSERTPKFIVKLDGYTMDINFAVADEIMEIVRPVEGVLGTIAAVLMFGGFASSKTGSSSGGAED